MTKSKSDLEQKFEIDFLTTNSLTFAEAFILIHNGYVIEFYGSNNRQPESPGFTYNVKSIKKLCKLFAKLGRKFSYVEMKQIQK